MKIWLLLFVAFLIQEPVSSSAILLEAYQYHYNIWLIHLLFVAATLLDVVIGYALGSFVRKKTFHSNARLIRYGMGKSDELSAFIGKQGKIMSLVVLGPIIFPWSAFVAPWLEISFFDAMVFLFIGDLIFWYGSEWLIVLGVKTFFPNPIAAVFAVVAVSLLITIGIKYLKSSKKKGGHGNESA
jgi:hypothetical protein